MDAKELPDVDLADLKLDTNNPKIHTDRNLKMIAESLTLNGAARSIVIDEDNRVVIGSGTTEAAIGAGLKKARIVDAEGDELIAVRRKGLTPEQRATMAVYDNRSAELGSWDGVVLRGLDDAGTLKLSGLFSDAELEKIGAGVVEPLSLLDSFPDLPAGLGTPPEMPAPADGKPVDGPKLKPEPTVATTTIHLTEAQHKKFTNAVQVLRKQRGAANATDVIYEVIIEEAGLG